MDRSLDSLTPDTRALAEQLLALAAAEGYDLLVVSTRRTCAEQNALYAQGRTAPGNIVTKARGCMSWHVLGRAFDIAIRSPKNASAADWQRIGALGESVGLKWGGHFKSFVDLPHFEYHPGQTMEQACPDPDDCEGAIERAWGDEEGGTLGGEESESEGSSVLTGLAVLGVTAILVSGAIVLTR